ncbi:acyl-CoA desaturase [Candidatus Nomurabacteria bacterium]|nr:acyl-CoA desaturase [Candidatus Nomurabacteria bacterium]
MIIYVFFFAHWYLSLFTQSFFYHRYSAHGMFLMSKTTEKVFFVLSWLFQGSSYLSPWAYGVMHRMHHAYADTPLDPHSPLYDHNLWNMMWKTKNIYNSIFYKKADFTQNFYKNLPIWTAMDKFADSWANRLFWVFLYITFYVIFATHWYQYLLLPIHFVMGPFHGAIINWFAHKYGYVNNKVNDTSKNLMAPDILMWGESYHNNHHKFPSSPNFGRRWFEIDPMYPIILILDKIGLIKLVR